MRSLNRGFCGVLAAGAFFWMLSSAALPLSAQQYSEQDIADRQTVAYPLQRLQRDWIYQDLESLKGNSVFNSKTTNAAEKKLMASVLGGLKAVGAGKAAGEIEKAFKKLSDSGKPGADPAWQDLYFRACGLRRKERLELAFKGQPRTFIYAKHFVFGDAQAMFAMTDHLTDAVARLPRQDAADIPLLRSQASPRG